MRRVNRIKNYRVSSNNSRPSIKIREKFLSAGIIQDIKEVDARRVSSDYTSSIYFTFKRCNSIVGLTKQRRPEVSINWNQGSGVEDHPSAFRTFLRIQDGG